MLLGLEYKASDRVLIASHFDEHHRVNFIIKPLKPADAFIWRPSRSVTDFKSWDGKFLKKEPSIRLNRFRLDELMHDKFTEKDWEVLNARHEPKAWFLDIEVGGNENDDFPEAEEARYPVNLISLATINEKVDGVIKFTVFALTTLADYNDEQKITIVKKTVDYFAKHNIKVEINLKYMYFLSEKAMLEFFFHKMLAKIPLICGWNVIEFDWQTLVNRCDRLDINPFQFLPSETTFGRFRIPIHTGMIDYITCCLKFRPLKKPENHQLDYFAKRVLGVSKLKHPYKSFYEFQKDADLFIQYNIIDSLLVALVDNNEKFQLLKSAYEISRVSGVELNRIFGPVFMTEIFMCRMFYEDGLIIPTKKQEETDEKKYAGAYVKQPIPGFYEEIACFDFTSMYPFIQMQFNISPDAYLGKIQNLDLKNLPCKSYTITKNDTVFSLDKDSAARRILLNLYNERAWSQKERDRLKDILKKDSEIDA